MPRPIFNNNTFTKLRTPCDRLFAPLFQLRGTAETAQTSGDETRPPCLVFSPESQAFWYYSTWNSVGFCRRAQHFLQSHKYFKQIELQNYLPASTSFSRFYTGENAICQLGPKQSVDIFGTPFRQAFCFLSPIPPFFEPEKFFVEKSNFAFGDFREKPIFVLPARLNSLNTQ